MEQLNSKKELLELLLKKQKLQAKKDFWEFCKLREPDFYKDTRQHLKDICYTLQNLYEGTLINSYTKKTYRCLMLNLPPRHGKSRTLTNFTAWCLGNDIKNMVMTISYNDNSATEFSRFTRDIIMQEQIKDTIAFSDIFPGVCIKQGNASVEKWALEGRFFSYLGAGFNGSITGKGCNILIIDDPIKNAEEALNEEFLDKIYRKYTDTLLSRVEGDGIQIICMTRWSKNDLCGKILDSEDKDDWYILNLPAYDEQKDKMLCTDILNKSNFLKLKRNMSDIIFLSNYQQEPIDVKGILYTNFKTYTDTPIDESGNINFECIVSYTDTADEGSDYLCSLIAGVYKGEAWVLDVIYMNEGMEITEPVVAVAFVKNKVNIAQIESNNGGKGFARNIDDLIWEKYKTRSVVIKWFHQSKNKTARILSNSAFIMNHIYFPWNWKSKWPKYFKDMLTYKREGKNKHDDAPDATTGLAEILQNKFRVTKTNKRRKGGRVGRI